ncbi:CPBP family intramembrane glutamic endopeptidase [Lacisediminihabitans sp.]|uniref:CPBP family intramembrane glutamic endopeptidase n=1 Tax=Lacisediminihabitans sp. TaxID=2787631 RepID=UPI00374D963C
MTTRPVLAYLAIAFGLSWLFAVPLWLSGGLKNPWFLVIALFIMATPAAAALLVSRFVDRPASIPRGLGLWPIRPVRRTIGYAGLGVLLTVAIILVALPIGALLGVYPADFVHLSGFQQTIDGTLAAVGAPPLPVPIQLLAAAQLLNVLLGTLINTIPALGEELGWRGFLFPRLLALGPVPAILLSGVIWGAWHAPLILLGYNYPAAPGWLGVLAMIGMCTLVGAIFGWLRIRSLSVWPAAVAHGAFNAAAGFSLVFVQVGRQIDTLQATILGWSGWIVPLVIVVVLVVTGQFRPRPAAPVSTEDAMAATA